MWIGGGRAPDGATLLPGEEIGRRLEAHERWAYDEREKVQSLRRLICLCSDRHGATHFGLAQVKGTDAAARAHPATVTGLDTRALDPHIRDAFALRRRATP